LGEYSHVSAPAPKRTILVADDEEEIRRVVSIALASQGHTVVLAEDGEEAFQKALAEKPDAILLDIRMPKLDGLRLLAKIKAESALADIPVGFLTAREDLEAYEQARDLGAHVYLMKPFSAPRLITFVGLLLGESDE